MTNRKLEEICSYIIALCEKAKKDITAVHYVKVGKTKYRLFISSNDELCAFAPKSRRQGQPLSHLLHLYFQDNLAADFPVIVWKNDAADWEKSIDRLIALLEKSGLWTEVLAEAKEARQIGYQDLQLLNRLKVYGDGKDSIRNAERQELLKKFNEKYPLLVKNSGTEYYPAVSQYAYPFKIKAMNFGKDVNEHYRKNIAEALANKEAYHCSGRTSYDVSFSYQPDRNIAFYSEEYKNCGNGHYYLAIDATHAVYWEKD